MILARFLSLAQSKRRLCSANHWAGYFSNLVCDWLNIVWANSEQGTENGPCLCMMSSCIKTSVLLTLSIEHKFTTLQMENVLEADHVTFPLTLLLHWCPGIMSAILLAIFSTTVWLIKRIHRNMFVMTQLKIIGWDNGLVPNKRQAIISHIDV